MKMISNTIICAIILFITSSSYLIRCDDTVYDEKVVHQFDSKDIDLNEDLTNDMYCSSETKQCWGDTSYADAFKYLQRYGYISDDQMFSQITKNDFSDALYLFQKNMAIETSGQLSDSVIKVMKRNRCSVPDIDQTSKGMSRQKRSISSKKWMPYDVAVPELPLNWLVIEEDGAEPKSGERYAELIDKASKVWTQVADIQPRQLLSPELSYYHNIYFMIGKVDTKIKDLAYDYLPTKRKTVFRIASNFEYNAFNVTLVPPFSMDQINSGDNLARLHFKLVHIWGHLFGLNHTLDGTDSVMNPNLEIKNEPLLNSNDITDILTLYGMIYNMSDTEINNIYMNKKRADWHSNATDLCVDPRPDAILEMPDETWIIFRAVHYYEVGPYGLTLRSPRRILWDFKNFFSSVDAAFAWDDVVFLFNVNEFVKYKVQGYDYTFIEKRNISDGFKGVPDGPFDDVFVWNVNQKTYFFKGGQYWKYDSLKKEVPSGYPKKISEHWKGIPDSIDAAISSRHRNQTYFFKDKQYYRFDDINKKVVDDSNPPFPRKTDIWFYKCRNRGNVPKLPLLDGGDAAPLPTPSYDNEPEFSDTSNYDLDDQNGSYEGTLITILILTVLVIVIGGAIFAYLFFVVRASDEPRAGSGGGGGGGGGGGQRETGF